MNSYEEIYLKNKSGIRKLYSLLSTPENINIQRIYSELQQSLSNADVKATNFPKRFW